MDIVPIDKIFCLVNFINNTVHSPQMSSVNIPTIGISIPVLTELYDQQL